MTGHAFLAVDLTDDERHALSGALADASQGHPLPGRRPPTRNWHITLRFLGECSDAEADRVIHEVEEGMTASFGKVHADGLGAFPRASKATVLFATIDDNEGLLDQLAGVCETAARDVGFEPEERPYVPHVTLSRLRPHMNVRRTIDSFAPFRVPIVVSTITLLRSAHTPSGITYTPLHTLTLP